MLSHPAWLLERVDPEHWGKAGTTAADAQTIATAELLDDLTDAT
jgi:hypothetical protein